MAAFVCYSGRASYSGVEEYLVQGLSHVTFIVRDLDRTEEILRTVFAARKVYDSGTETSCSRANRKTCSQVRRPTPRPISFGVTQRLSSITLGLFATME
jgi:catechol 2,3-dioxygenase-like lactoylglutathione lyase family enzyme